MLLLVQCKRRLEDKGAASYSLIAGHVFGRRGALGVDCLLIISQVGFCVGYLVFIGQNARSIDHLPKWLHIFGVFPILCFLAMLRSLTALAPFSLFADAANVVGISVVMYHDLVDGLSNPTSSAFMSSEGVASLPFLFGVCMYCFEGFGLILPIEASMQDRSKFTSTLTAGVVSITLLFLTFALMGYAAYGNHTEDIITLNLPNGAAAIVVKVSLCLGLLFTFPVMMVPVYEIVETSLEVMPWFTNMIRPQAREQAFSTLRAAVVLLTTLLAASVPGFGLFISLVGSLVCALLAFVLPALIHFQMFKDEMGWAAMLKDISIVLFGLTGAALGTMDAINGVLYSEEAHYTDIATSFNVTVVDTPETQLEEGAFFVSDLESQTKDLVDAMIDS